MMSDLPSDHGKGIVAREEWTTGDVGDSLFPRVYQIGVNFLWQGVGALSTKTDLIKILAQITETNSNF